MNGVTLVLSMLGIIGGVLSIVTAVIKKKKMAVQISAFFLIAVGVVVVIGYLADAPQVYTFPNNRTSMALPTGLCFLIIGVCLFILAEQVEFKK